MLKLTLDRGQVDSLGNLRPDFSVSGFLASGKPWKCYIVDGLGNIAVQKEDESRLWERQVLPGEAWLLGRTRDGITHFALMSDRCDESGTFMPLTAIGADLEGDQALLGAQAVAISRWHHMDQFCAGCGAAVEIIESGWATRCTKCGRVEYPRTDPAVIVRIRDEEDRVLLAHNMAWPDNRASFPAGFVEAGESPRRAVIREMEEEIGLHVADIEYLGAQPWPGPRSLMLAFDARVVGEGTPRPDGVEIDWAAFYSRDEYREALRSGRLRVPRKTAIANSMLADWFGEELPL